MKTSPATQTCDAKMQFKTELVPALRSLQLSGLAMFGSFMMDLHWGSRIRTMVHFGTNHSFWGATNTLPNGCGLKPWNDIHFWARQRILTASPTLGAGETVGLFHPTGNQGWGCNLNMTKWITMVCPGNCGQNDT